jgi:phage FluMu protein Com
MTFAYWPANREQGALMETIQLQCGNCKQLMAIGVEHLGSQVKCPHCGSVVQTPAPDAPKAELDYRESIFGTPDTSDAILGDAPEPKVELPFSPAPPEPVGAPTDATAASAQEAEFAQFKSRPVYTSSVLQMYALIFLVPYAIVMTGFVAYLLFNPKAQYDPLEMLRDPVPDTKKGAAKQVSFRQPKPNHPLADKLKTTLKNPIRVGDISVTFERVRLTEGGDLQLFMRARNVSTDTRFEPIHDMFLNEQKSPTPLYTFLEAHSKNAAPIRGGYLAYHKNADGEDDQRGSAILSPREEVFIALRTTEAYHKQVQTILAAKAAERFTWRVQVRRGLVSAHGKKVSATAIVGLEFTRGDIEPAEKKT